VSYTRNKICILSERTFYSCSLFARSCNYRWQFMESRNVSEPAHCRAYKIFEYDHLLWDCTQFS
jgi:hypothetical protein